MLAARCPCGISRPSLHPAAQRTHRPLLQRGRPGRTPWWRPPGYLCAATPRGRQESRVVTCGLFREMRRTVVACGAAVAAGEGAQSRSPLVPSGDGLTEGRQRGPEAAMSFGFS